MDNDLISKSELKKRIEECRHTTPQLSAVFDVMLAIIEDTPTVERPQGEWKFDGWGNYCSECGYRPKIGGGNFCKECGAKMKND